MGCRCSCNLRKEKGIAPTFKARRDPKRSGMIERDAVTSRAAVNGARNSATRFTAFDFNDNRRIVSGDNAAARWSIEYPPAQGGGISIAQRDILGVSRFGCTDGLGSAGFVVASRRVIGGYRAG